MAEPIAIVGSACRFPGSASSPSKLWDLLKAPKDVIRDFPLERLNLSNFYSQDGEYHGRTDVQNQSYLLQEDCRLFDAAFFQINPKEAHGMDPQQRILLETVFEAFEAAGWPLDTIEGSPTSVYVGLMTSDFNDIQMRDPETLPTYAATGLARSILSNRISYVFDLKGPSMTIDTACSSSLVALHQAVQCVRNGDAAQAIVAGSTLLLDPSMYIAESKLHMLSPDSRSRMWDKDANGYARGEGCAAVLLKPLSKAIHDNDHIECVIRETAVNSDGRTNGITMPSASAQTALIRQTYENAGLDPVTDRCQYFECHGTGTLAGDPVEARAIKEAFFPDRRGVHDDDPLYCGSVKTVIGHLEGCAGLAGVLKASLAIQNKAIPQNMHFKQLNPAIEPYYDNLRVPTSLLPWPETNGKPLRASVNSFGFGGTNAHAIIESYQPPSGATTADQDAKNAVSQMKLVGPFVFSAKSRSSLLRTLKEVSRHVHLNPSLDLDALSWVLHSRRTAFSMRAAIAASNRQRFLDSLEKQISMAEASADAQFGVRALAVDPIHQPPKMFGVFTGQGAQWATMGRELMTQCPLFRESLEKCESALRALPEAPSWSLTQELAAEGTDSRISQAQFSQPLCTAIQIALVDLLCAAGVKFNAVVGHSSGEIGAAYAAGILNARDAIGIAYYRGFVAHVAKGAAGQEGGMMAVGMSFEDAADFCSQPRFTGRIGVAASNAPSSVTLSGDLDAIREAKASLDEHKVFARLLQVDTAYHSHHMLHCAGSYMACLKQLDIRVQSPRVDCIWSSSVYGNADLLQGPLDQLKDQYWVDNMVRPVLFSQALEFALLCGRSFAVALEVGPHPALKGPVSQTLKPTVASSIPYAGCLERGGNDVESMSAALGLLWSHLGPSFVDFGGWRKAFRRPSQQRMLKNLPSYAWDHDQIYWQESRLSRNYRLGGQVIFPGAGYVSMAVQAAEAFVHGRTMKMVEIQDMNIPRALVIDEDSMGVETLFTVRSRDRHDAMANDSILEAEFVCYSCSDERALDKSCDGRLLIHLGQPACGDLPPSPISQAELPPLDVDRFFTAIAGLGIVYDGVFRAIRSINRTWGHSKASASWARGELGEQYALHPAILDVGFQTGFATFASIAEKAMGSTYLPAGIRRVIVDPAQNYRTPSGETCIGIEAHLTKSTSTVLEVDINLWDKLSNASGVQVDGLILKAIAEPQPSDDRLLFAKTVWDVDAACGLPSPPPAEVTRDELEYIDAVERTALFFMQNLLREVHPDEIGAFKWHHQALFRAIKTFLGPIREGCHTVMKKEWLDDSHETIREFAKRYPDSVDLALLTAVGENLPSVVRGESEMLEHMLKSNLLGRLYMEGRGFAACNEHVAALMRKISHKFPRTHILEIGAGTGGTTRSVLDAIGNAYSSYMYTDISAGFFEKAAEKFADHVHRMDFKTFNAENPPAEQGFTEGSYDIIIAANVLHATRRLSQTMRHARSLLRPGGFLIAVEVTGNMLREPGLMGGLEGWWLGVNDGRFPCPGISAKEWHDVLQASGFSGIDTIIYDMHDVSRHNCSVFVTQAVDERLDLLRDPLASIDLIPEARVMIVGGQTLHVSKAVRRAEKFLRRWTSHVSICVSIDALHSSEIMPETSILCLAELDQAIFSEAMSSRRLENLQELLGNAQNVLWVTSGRLADDPYSNMMIGIGRALSFELPHVHMQFLDFDQQSSWDMEMAVQYLLRMVLLSSPPYLDHNMLWVQEPEIEVNGSTTLVPRVLRDDAANEGFNAKRRRITKLVNQSERIEVLYGASQSSLVKRDLHAIPKEDSVEIDIELSVALHSRHEMPCFLCFGYLRGTGRPAFALTETDSSTAIVHEGGVFEPSMSSNCDSEKLVAMGSALIASHALSNSPTNGTILVHQPTNGVAEAIAKAATLAGRKVLFVATTAEEERPGWITIHPLAQTQAISRLIPSDTSILLRFSSVGVDNILPCLPKDCVAQNFDPSLISHQQTTIAAAYEMAPSARVRAAVSIASINDASRDHRNNERLSTVLDWKRTGPLSVTVPPLDARGIFSADKTYFMVGLAGELGQSLCRFMVNCGARHIALASRNPVSDANWLADMRVAGAEVRVVKMDVTDRSQVQAAASMIRDTMPEIAGVANAALVLEDTLFVNATVANIEKQLKPKVDGTIYLDEEFSKDNLDFFIAFSSLGSVYGNAGQSIYHAANMFMMSLVEKRRRRGRAGSVINIGMIVDVGYVAKSERAGTNIEEHLRSQFYTPLAETEFHHLFLQAALSGHPDSANADVTMGIQPFMDDPEASVRPHWYNNPRFSHMRFPPTSSDGRSQSSSSTQQLRKKLENAESVTEASEAFQELFCKKIESMMKVPAASIDVNEPLSDLGLDSLLAVEIRTWLLKDMHVDVSVLRILGRDSISSICSSAARKLVENRAKATESKPTGRTQDVQTEAEPAPAALDMDQSNTIGHSDSSAPRIEGSQETGSADSLPPSATITPSESAPLSESDSLEMHQGFTTSSASSVSNFPITPADLAEPKFALEYKRTGRMSFAQASLHFLHSFLDDPTTFNVTAQYDISGHLNVTRFSRALEKCLARHEAYQTCFFTDPGNLELKQGIASNINMNRFTHSHSTTAEDVQHIFQSLAKREWKLASGQTFQAILITHAPESHTVIFACHHIIMDGLSWHIFLQDLNRAYQMLPLNTIANSYVDFSRQQMEALDSGRLEESIGYWMRELDPIPSVLPLLPFAQTRSRKSRRAYGNHTVQRVLSVEMVQRVKDASQVCQVTPMQFYLAVMQTLFARLLELDEICIGVTDAGRANGDFAETIGHFTNLLPMRFYMSRERSFAELVHETSRTVLNGYGHAHVPIDLILQRLEMQRSPAYTPLFQVAFNYRIGDLLHRTLGNCTMDLTKYVDAKTPYDLTFNVTQTAQGGHLVEVSSSDYLYSTAATKMVMDTYVGLLDTLSLDQSTKVQDYKLYNDAQVERALGPGRGPRVQHPWPETLTERFHQVRSAFPDSVAIKDDGGSMTYEQLACRVGALAAALINAGVGPGARVVVLCEPSIDTYAAMLAILHIGAVYVPLDMSLPAARHRAMIEVCKPELLIFHPATTAAAAQCGHGGDIATLNLSEVSASAQEPPSAAAVNDSFLLFTSGSTGTPKGIRLSQGGIMNYAASKSATLGLGRVKVLQQSSTGFDMSVAQAFNAFANAGTLVVASSKARGDPIMIAQLMVDEAIEFTICTPSEYLMLATYAADSLRQCMQWRHACSGGEAVLGGLVSELQRLELPDLTLTDCYGPTEISCAATFRTIPLKPGVEGTGAPNSVGKTIPNISVYIVGNDCEALPAGFHGEICIGGRGVARGYLDANLSSSKFVRDPFATADDVARGWNVMYRTGDNGCLREDGSLTFLGRTDGDTLVKLRGLRIELNEVANVILHTAQGSLADAVVTVRGQPEFLVAHVVFARGEHLSESQLDTLCADLPLPRYMIPSMIIPLDRLPTSPNGKADRKAVGELPLPARSHESDKKVSLTVAEGELRLVWRAILGEAAGAANIQTDTDFFTIGGSSLLLARLQNALKERMGVQMPLHDLYQASTLGKMAAMTSKERSQVLTETIDWAAETLIPAHVLNAAQAPASPAPRRHQRHVVLTGSTGFLGSEILGALMNDNDVAKIHCIAVPADARHKLPSYAKVIVYLGSLLSSNLGLSGREVAFLQSNVDQIIHAGAQGHCLNNYSSVRHANYLSTQFLVTMALPRRVPLHFISSARVILQSGSCTAAPVSMAAHPPPADGSQGFTASKWASECFLENVVRETGLPVAIHRPCSVIGTRAPHDDAMNSVIRYSILSRTVPAVPNAEGFFDFKDVVAVAAEIARDPVAEKSICFRHHSSGVRVPFSQLAQRMESIHGGKFEEVSMSDWIRSAVELGIEDLIVSYLEANVAGGANLTFPYLGMS
ncbi:lovastatin nonaketide synthase [Aspergillus novofumigatus IBT 16806]|uniref:Lovastatin nonaketide synthase n=1 Tax=Aspergillus novofumigatus (strain IBT 16806) TaxID=1392255 RepID=A0A2I1BUZ7_ASPN1|nr:lovastatin nonaketide synthase [Aspergillus novofumigatus IBT 16806]PKX89195.1 lovastatin nonaketide synthase [Aspergillus novofumigatus IBT 16806]